MMGTQSYTEDEDEDEQRQEKCIDFLKYAIFVAKDKILMEMIKHMRMLYVEKLEHTLEIFLVDKNLWIAIRIYSC